MGIRLVNYCEAATITRCTIEDNTNSGLEANQYATVTIDDSVFSGNSDGYGGAVYMNTGASITIADSEIHENTSTSQGGAFWVGGTATLTLTDATVTTNTASQTGGAIWINNNSTAIVNGGTLSGNTATNSNGGAIMFQWSGDPTSTITNSTFGGNRASGEGGAIAIYGRPVTITNSILWGNYADGSTNDQIYWTSTQPTVTYNDIDQDGYTGNNNIRQNPLFVDAEPYTLAPTTEGDYHLDANSPCEDEATSTVAPPDDIEGDSRPQENGDDMGSDEYVDGGVGGLRSRLSAASESCLACHWVNLNSSSLIDETRDSTTRFVGE